MTHDSQSVLTPKEPKASTKYPKNQKYQPRMQATIITIGDEILIGQTIDTNSAWMGEKLNDIGVKIYEILSISDSKEHIIQAVDKALKDSEIVLVTGGLGPTKDDITKKTLAEYFNTELVVDEEIMADLVRFFEKRKRPLLDSVKGMAYLPKDCEVIRNLKGTAAAMLFQRGEKILVSMPGVPYEMKDFMSRVIIPRIQQQFNTPVIIHQTTLCGSLGESIVANMIKDVEDNLPPHIKLAYLPGMGILRLRLSGHGTDAEALEKEVSSYTHQIKEIMYPKYAFGSGEDKLEAVIGDLLKEKNATLSTAESCTGGLIAHKLTSIPGSSAYYMGGAVTYSNELKMSVLGVKKSTLEAHGAVSEETVKEMAQGAILQFDTDYSIAVSGIAGPGGGTPEKPVGTVWIAVANRERVVTRHYTFSASRSINVQISTTMGLVFVRRLIMELL